MYFYDPPFFILDLILFTIKLPLLEDEDEDESQLLNCYGFFFKRNSIKYYW